MDLTLAWSATGANSLSVGQTHHQAISHHIFRIRQAGAILSFLQLKLRLKRIQAWSLNHCSVKNVRA